MLTGCYIIGDESIHLSTDIFSSFSFPATEDYITLFEAVCEKLDNKLECLVIINSLSNDEIADINPIYKIAKEYANFVYIISPTVALLQNFVSLIENVETFTNDTVIVFIVSTFGVLTCILEKANELFFVSDIIPGSFIPPQIAAKSAAKFCFYDRNTTSHFDKMYAPWPDIIKIPFDDPLEALTIGGLKKALCIIESKNNFEIINFTPGIIVGQELVLEACRTFPRTVHYSSPCCIPHTIRYIDTLQIAKPFSPKNPFTLLGKILYISNMLSPMNYIIKYDEFGVLTIKPSIFNPIPPLNCTAGIFIGTFAVWLNESSKFAEYNFQKNMVQFSKIQQKFETSKNFQNLNQMEKLVQVLAAPYSALTIICDNKIEYKMKHSSVHIIPSYIPLLEYCIRQIQPKNEKIIIFITTKIDSKFYVLLKHKTGIYTVAYISTVASSVVKDDIFRGYKNVGIIHLIENDPTTKLLFFDTKVSASVNRIKTSDLQATLFQGALMYSTLHSQNGQILPYATFDPEHQPLNVETENLKTNENICHQLFEIELIFLQLLSPFSNKTVLFWGDLITLLIPKNKNIQIHFFTKINQKYFLHDFITVNNETLLTSNILKFSTNILVFGCETLNFDSDVSPSITDCSKNGSLNDYGKSDSQFYQNQKYKEAINYAKENDIFSKIVVNILAIECDGDSSCRIPLEDETFLNIAEDEWIPMCISFTQDSLRIGQDAIDDLKKFRDFVICDIMKYLTMSYEDLVESKDPLKLVAMDKSDIPKFGFKVKTTQGFKIISFEMAFAAYLKKLIEIYKNYTKHEKVTMLKFLIPMNKFNKSQRKIIKRSGNILERNLSKCKFTFEIKFNEIT